MVDAIHVVVAENPNPKVGHQIEEPQFGGKSVQNIEATKEPEIRVAIESQAGPFGARREVVGVSHPLLKERTKRTKEVE
jgi:hypothetical protein